MRIVLVGAGGAIGLPLTRRLVQDGHEVLAVTRSPASHPRLRALGAAPVAADVLEEPSLRGAFAGVSADAVVHQLTALKKPPLRHGGMRATNRLRTEGTRNLVRLAEDVGATRFVTQSMLFGYGYGDSRGQVWTEDDPFGLPAGGAFAEHLDAMRSNEEQVLGADSFDGVALRYGLFYGVGAGDDAMVDSLSKRRLPVLREAGPLSWIYLDDAVSATVAALDHGTAGEAYNVVDDEPVSWTTMMSALATVLGAPAPRALPRWMLAAIPYARTMMDGGMCASNLKARRKLHWSPAVPTYRSGVELIRRQHAG